MEPPDMVVLRSPILRNSRPRVRPVPTFLRAALWWPASAHYAIKPPLTRTCETRDGNNLHACPRSPAICQFEELARACQPLRNKFHECHGEAATQIRSCFSSRTPGMRIPNRRRNAAFTTVFATHRRPHLPNAPEPFLGRSPPVLPRAVKPRR